MNKLRYKHPGDSVRIRYGFGAVRLYTLGFPNHVKLAAQVANYIDFGTAVSFCKDCNGRYMAAQNIGEYHAPNH